MLAMEVAVVASSRMFNAAAGKFGSILWLQIEIASE
jgi:hypothetical protein